MPAHERKVAKTLGGARRLRMESGMQLRKWLLDYASAPLGGKRVHFWIGGITMSIAGIFSSNSSSNQTQPQYQITSSQFQKLGQDLSSGNLSSAQSDFAALQQIFGQAATASSTSTSSTAAASTSNPLGQAFQQLSSDLKSGNLTAAQKDYSTIQQDLQSDFASRLRHGHHHVRTGFDPLNSQSSQSSQNTPSDSTQSSSAVAQLFASLAQQLQNSALGGATGSAGASSSVNPISLVA